MTTSPSLLRLCSAAALALGLLLTAGPAAAQSTPKVVKKTPMEFPGEAIRRGVDRGVLKARLTIDGEGAVTAVDIVDTQPAKAKVLNNTVIEGLKPWRFEPGKAGSFELQVVLTSE